MNIVELGEHATIIVVSMSETATNDTKRICKKDFLQKSKRCRDGG